MIKTVYWLDELSVFSSVKLIFIILININFKLNEVNYLSYTTKGKLVFFIGTRMLKIINIKTTSEFIDYDLYDLRNTNKENSTFNIDLEIDLICKKITCKLINNIDLNMLNKNILRQNYSIKQLNLYLERSISYEIYKTVLNLYVISLLNIQNGNQKNIFIINNNVFFNEILNAFSVLNSKNIKTYNNYKEFISWSRIIIGLIIQIKNSFFYFILYTIKKILWDKKLTLNNNTKEKNRIKIAVQY